MDVLTHFRSIEELTKTLSREQGLLSEMFEKRKLMRFPVALAIDLVGGNEARLRKLIDYGVLVEAGNMVQKVINFVAKYRKKHYICTKD